MRYLALLIVLASFPIMIGILRTQPHRRALVCGLLSMLLFVTGTYRVETYILDWPYWSGTVRGLAVSPVDTISLALLFTRRRGSIFGFPFWTVFLLFLFVSLGSVFVSSTRMASFFSVWQFARVLLLFAAVAGEATDQRTRQGLLAGVSLGLLLQAAFVVQQKASGVVQATGIVGHQNTLGMMVELALLPLLASLFAGSRSKITLAGVGAALVIVAAGASRGTLGFVSGGLALYAALSLIRSPTARKFQLISLGAIMILIASPLAYRSLNDRFKGRSLVTAEEERSALKDAARAIAVDHPLGVGANQYVTVSNLKGYAARAGVPWNRENRSAPVHNAYLLARAELGWLGEASLLALLIVPLLRGIRAAFKRPRGSAGELALGASVAVAVNVAHNNFEFAFFSYPVMSLLFVDFAFIAGCIRDQATRNKQQAGRPRVAAGYSDEPHRPRAMARTW